MKCDSCQEKATVFYTQVADGKLKKFVLCEVCAQAKGITNPEGLLMAEELLGAAAPAAGIPDLAPFESAPSGKCSSCDFTLEDLQKVGRLGCPECYRTFAGEIAQRLPSMHKGLIHMGYIPDGLVKQQALRNERSDLEARLKKAVSAENFEEAAKVKGLIDALKLGESTEEGAVTS